MPPPHDGAPPILDTVPVTIDGAVVYVSKQEAVLQTLGDGVVWLFEHPHATPQMLALGALAAGCLYLLWPANRGSRKHRNPTIIRS
jgi:hypothetical protein